MPQITRWFQRRACLARCGGQLATERTTELVVGATDCRTATQTIKTSSISRSSQRGKMLSGWISSNSSSTTKSYACASFAFLGGINSWSVDSIHPRSAEPHDSAREFQGFPPARFLHNENGKYNLGVLIAFLFFLPILCITGAGLIVSVNHK